MERKQKMVMALIWLLLSNTSVNHGSHIPVASAFYEAGSFVPALGNSSVIFKAVSVVDCARICEMVKQEVCEVFRFNPGSGQCVVAKMKHVAQYSSQPSDGGKSYKKVIQFKLL